MKNRKRKVSVLAGILAAVMLLSLILGLIPVNTRAASSSEIKKQIEALKGEKKEIDDQLKNVRGQIKDNDNEIKNIVAQKDAIDQEIQLLHQQVDMSAALTGDHLEYLGWVALERVLNQKPSV